MHSIYRYPQIDYGSIQIKQPEAIPTVQTEEKLEELSDSDSDATIEDTQSCHKAPPSSVSMQIDEELNDLFSL